MARASFVCTLFSLLLVLEGCPDPQDDDTSAGDDDTSLGDNDDTTSIQDDDDSSGTHDDLDGDGFSADDGDCDDADATSYPDAAELCDGSDNDCDGQVDEGFPDSDGDGIDDCHDDGCEVQMPAEARVEMVSSCPWVGAVTTLDPWDVVLEWSFPSEPSHGPMHQPVVVNLTDDNGDHVIDEADVPDIVLGGMGSTEEPTENRIVALHGDGSGVIFDVSGFAIPSGLAAGDVNDDGQSEVLVSYGHNYIGTRTAAISNTGAILWESVDYYIGVTGGYDMTPTIADLDGDGSVEVVVGWAVLDGATGQVEFESDGFTNSTSAPVVADLDRDGTAEIIVGNHVYSHVGEVEWSMENHCPGGSIFFSAVADLDGDAGGEVVVVSGNIATFYDEDGTLLDSFDLGLGTLGGPPAIADFDGDGEVEIAISIGDPSDPTLFMLELDGTVRWSTPSDDTSGAAGCSAFDFDADGAYEVVFAAVDAVSIRDGSTGEPRFVWYYHDSGTFWEYPVVADVDSDGSAEIVTSCNRSTTDGDGYCRGIQVFGHASDGWPPAGPTWSIHDYAPMRLRTDGQINTEPLAWWDIHNMFRARPPGDGLAELYPVEGEVCVASCLHGPIQVSWGIGNRGHVNAPGAVQAALYSLDGDTETLVGVQAANGVQYGSEAPGGIFELTLDQWGDGIRIVVDDDGTGVGAVDECDETNNVQEILGPICE